MLKGVERFPKFLVIYNSQSYAWIYFARLNKQWKYSGNYLTIFVVHNKNLVLYPY